MNNQKKILPNTYESLDKQNLLDFKINKIKESKAELIAFKKERPFIEAIKSELDSLRAESNKLEKQIDWLDDKYHDILYDKSKPWDLRKRNLEKIQNKRNELRTKKFYLEHSTIRDKEKELKTILEDFKITEFNIYKLHAGEIESRVAEFRANFTPDELSMNYPYKFQPKQHEAITKFDKSQSEMVEGYHGSPYSGIKKMLLEKIGSGEGGAVFGWGLYFSDLIDVAKIYAKGREAGWKVGGKIIKESEVESPTIYNLLANGQSKQKVIETFETAKNVFKDNQEVYKQYDRQLQIAKSLPDDIKVEHWKSGGLYKVRLHSNIPEGQENWLEWYEKVKPEQMIQIRKQLEKEDLIKHASNKQYGLFNDFSDENIENILHYQYGWELKDIDFYKKEGYSHPKMLEMATEVTDVQPEIKGEILYKQLANDLGYIKKYNTGEANYYKEASEFLDRAGIHGIRYPTGTLSSKSFENTGYNYVIFNPDAIDIIEELAIK